MIQFKAKLKLVVTHFVRDLLKNKFRHYAWPRRLSSRLFDFNEYYSAEKNKNGACKRVNIGAGPYFKRAGWVSADFLPHFKGKNKNLVHLDLLKNPDKFPFSNVRAIYASHTLEHFHVDWTERLIKSAYNSLESGGYFRIVVPDARLVLEKVRQNDIDYFKPFESFFLQHKNANINIYDYGLHFLSQQMCKYDRKTVRKKDYVPFFKELLASKTDDEIVKILNDNQFQNDNSGTYHLSCYTDSLLISLLKKAGFKKAYKSAFMQSNYGPMREAPIFDGTHPWLSLYIEAKK